jgi:hypothetical protein
MTEVAEFQPITDWRPNGLRALENGSYPEPRMPDDTLRGRAWASLRRSTPAILPIPAEIVPLQQISPIGGLLADVDRFVYGLLDVPVSNGPAIEIGMPLDDWFWCGDPAMMPRVCLKKRTSILSHFGG